MDPPTSIRSAMGADHDDDGDMEPVFIDEGDCESDEVYDEEMWVDGVPVWSRCAP